MCMFFFPPRPSVAIGTWTHYIQHFFALNKEHHLHLCHESRGFELGQQNGTAFFFLFFFFLLTFLGSLRHRVCFGFFFGRRLSCGKVLIGLNGLFVLPSFTALSVLFLIEWIPPFLGQWVRRRSALQRSSPRGVTFDLFKADPVRRPISYLLPSADVPLHLLTQQKCEEYPSVFN